MSSHSDRPNGRSSDDLRAAGIERLIYFEPFLITEGVGKFGDECSLLHCAGRGSPFIVDHKKITQRFVDQIKSNITVNLFGLAVVLDKPVQEHSGIE